MKNISIDGVSEGRNILYEEKAPFSSATQWIVILGGFILAMFYFLQFFFSLVDRSPGRETIRLMVVVLYSFIMWSFLGMKFRITDKSVEAVMPPFVYSIPLSEITGMRTIENIQWQAGWGLWVWGDRLAFISMHKDAVEVGKGKGFFKKVLLTTRDPEEFIDMVNRYTQNKIKFKKTGGKNVLKKINQTWA